MRRPGGVDQYPAVTIEWKLHHKPELFGYDADGNKVGGPVDLSSYKNNYDGLHVLFSQHFSRSSVKAPNLAVRTWRRFFGWGYGLSTFEATLFFICGSLVLLLACYTVCCRYTACCDALQDI